MLSSPTLVGLAEAIADGCQPDWNSAESSASADRELALIRHMRAVSQIGRVRATLYTTGLVTGLIEFPVALQPGTRWGSLRILEKVGRGHFGDVYRAWDPTLDREVALKILRHHAAGAAETAT
ncbi:MAG: hypothetical protein LC804_28160 [Acidobacteria bacterium]|nr:hypothetical protein [Acidobacteriota bacterium]